MNIFSETSKLAASDDTEGEVIHIELDDTPEVFLLDQSPITVVILCDWSLIHNQYIYALLYTILNKV